MFYCIQSMASNFSTLPKTHNRLAKYRNVQYQSSRLASQINIISVGNDFAQWKTDQFAARETRAPLLRLCGIYRSIQLHMVIEQSAKVGKNNMEKITFIGNKRKS